MMEVSNINININITDVVHQIKISSLFKSFLNLCLWVHTHLCIFP